MKGFEEFVKLFGGITIGEVAQFLLALVFLYAIYKEIKKWIDDQMAMRSCIVVLIGKTTSSRKWVKYEIEKAYELNKDKVTKKLLLFKKDEKELVPYV